MEKLQSAVKEFGTKIDQLSQSAKTMKEEQEMIKYLVNSWEVKQKRIGEELSFVVDWHRKNNMLIFGIDEYPHESYFDMLKISEEFLRTKMKELAHRQCNENRKKKRLPTDFGKIHLIFKENRSTERNLKFSGNKYKD
jgi:hypothetical protein